MENNKEIMKAIHNVQQSAEYIKKESQGQVGTGKFNYANLVSTWEAIKQLLKDEDITVYQTPTYTVPSSAGSVAGGHFFKTTLYHNKSGESLTEYMQMILTRQDPQAIGAAITFYRRYMLTSMLGLIPDDDNDAREQRLATAQQKLQIVGAVKLVFAKAGEEFKPEQINQTIENIIGKHPSLIREDEAENVINLIKAYKDEQTTE